MKNDTFIHQAILTKIVSKDQERILVEWHNGEWVPVSGPCHKVSGYTIRVIAEPVFPAFFPMQNGGYDGFMYRILRVITDKFNVTIEFVPNNHPGIRGRQLKNGTWTGMLGTIIDNQACFLTARTCTRSRKNVQNRTFFRER